MPPICKLQFRHRARIACSSPNSMGCAIFSSSRIWHARRILSSLALREHDALRPALRLVNHDAHHFLLAAQPALELSRYSSRSIGTCATPVSIAAFATADASHIRTRASNGLGMMYSGPNSSRSRP